MSSTPHTTWTVRLDKINYAVSETFGGLSGEQLNWKPNTSTWSIAQNLDHLIRVNESYYPVLQALQEGKYRTPFLGRFGAFVFLFGRMILSAVEPERKRRMKTMALWEPSASAITDDIVVRFGRHQQELISWLNRSQEFVRSGVVIASPANANIVYKLSTAFEIIVTHEERHLAQAREVLSLLPAELSSAER